MNKEELKEMAPQLIKKLPIRAYILFVMCSGNLTWFKRAALSANKFIEAIKNHNK